MKTEIIENLKNNWKSWLTVALINIPLSISIAVASGATPLQWLLTGIWWGLFAAIFASSRYNIFGVAWALTSILLAFALTNGPELLPLLAIVSWVMIIIISLLKITKYITLLPSTVLHGFLISVWVTIALWQLSAALWLNNPALHIHQHKEIYMNLVEIVKNIWSTNIVALVVSLLWFSFLFITKRKYPSFPWVIVLTVVWVILWYLVSKGYLPNMLLLTDKYANLQFKLFEFPFLKIRFDSIRQWIEIIKPLLVTSLVIAIIAILETTISAKIAEKMTKQKFNKDKEVLWLWMSNLFSGLLWWLPSTAVFIRTALNIKSGATSKYSAWITAIFTLLISALFLTWCLKYLPFPIIAAILINIAVWLIDINLLKKLYKLEKRSFYITLLVTFVSVFYEPTYWIILWTAISLLIFLKWVTNWNAKVSIFRNKNFFDKMWIHKYVKIQENNDILLLKFVWWLNYLNLEHNLQYVEQLNSSQSIIISFSHMWNLDIDWFEALEEIVHHLKSKWIIVYFSWIWDKIKPIVSKLDIYAQMEKDWKIISSTSLALSQLLWKDKIWD